MKKLFILGIVMILLSSFIFADTIILDDFDDGSFDTSKWTKCTGDTVLLETGSRVEGVTSGTSINVARGFRNGLGNISDQVIRFNFSNSDTANNFMMVWMADGIDQCGNFQSTTKALRIISAPGGTISCETIVSGVPSNTIALKTGSSNNEYFIGELMIRSDNTLMCNLYEQDGTFIAGQNITTFDIEGDSAVFGIGDFDTDAGIFRLGWIQNITTAPDSFELTLQNSYNSSSINTFTANITNSSNPTGTVIHTTNSSIRYPLGQIVNIIISNVTGSEGVYFNQTFTDVNTDNNFEGKTWQSILILFATDTLGSLILNFNASASADLTQFNISNSTGNVTFHLNTQEYNITSSAENYNANATLSINTTAADFTFGVLTFPLNMINVTAIDKQNNNVILNFNASINGGLFFNITTIGWMLLPCPTPTCSIDINSSLFIPRSFTGHNANNDFQANLSNRTNSFFFNDATLNTPIVNANITISSPLGRTLQLITDSNGRVQFSSMNGDAFDQGSYSITLESFLGFITPITFIRIINFITAPENTTFNISTANIIVNVFDRETGNLLTGTEVNIFVFELLNETTTTGSITLQNVSIEARDYVFQGIATGFGTEQVTVTYTGQTNLTIDLYLLNLTGVNTGDLFVSVVDEFDRLVPGATVQLLEYNSSVLSFIQISECITNSNGECQFFIELNVKTYILQGSKIIDGVNFTDIANPEIFQITGETRDPFLRLTAGKILTVIDGVLLNATETFTNTTAFNLSQINVFFRSLDGTSRQVCLEYFNESFITPFNQQCVTATSGIIIGDTIVLNRSFDYTAKIFIVSGSTKFLYTQFLYPSENSLDFLFSKDNYAKPMVIFFWILLFTLGMYMKNTTFIAAGTIVLAWVEVAVFPSLIVLGFAVLKSVLGGTLLIISRKRQDSG